MVLAATNKVVLGSIAFAVFWVLAVFPAVPFLPIGRTAGSLLGAMLMVIFQILSPNHAYASIDLPILGLLFGTMVVSIYLEKADMFKYLGKLLAWKCQGAKDLLCRICFISALSSALFTNDTSCIVLTEFVIKLARQKKVPYHPFLLALASSANIGSSATPIGNPQNLVIAIQSGISFGKFLLGVLPAMLVGIVVNVLILLCMYWKVLSVDNDEEDASAAVISEEVLGSHRILPAIMSHSSLNAEEWTSRGHDSYIRRSASASDILNQGETLRSITNPIEDDRNSTATKEMMNSDDQENFLSRRFANDGLNGSMSNVNDLEEGATALQSVMEEEGALRKGWIRLLRKTFVYLITVGMLIAFLTGLNLSWSALTAALALVVLDFKDAWPCLEKVSYSLLVFFCGMFITVEGFNSTGVPSVFWNAMEPHAQVNHVSGIAVLSIVILVLSNVVSNVPTVLLLGAKVAASAALLSSTEVNKAWLILAWVSTVAGNFSLLGSAANLIVCEQARRPQFGAYTLTFWTHLKFGVPSTLIVTAIGLPLIRG